MDDLRAWQDAVARICLDPSPDAAAFEGAGGYASRWSLYRTMVRTRFRRVLREGAPRLTRVLGPDPMDALVDRYLAERPPRARLLRDLVGEFASWCDHAEALEPEACEALAYDAAVIHARDALDPSECAPGTEAGAFAFDAPVRLSAACRLLHLSHGAHRGGDASRGPEWVLVYRHATTHEPRWLVLSPIEAEVVGAWGAGTGPVSAVGGREARVGDVTAAEAAMAAAEASGTPVDASFAGLLGDLAGRLLERGVLYGAAHGGAPQTTA